MKTKTAVGVGLFILSAFILTPTHRAHACSCAMPSPATEELENSDAVFIGTVDNIFSSSLYGSDTLDVNFSVEKAYKGSTEAEQILKTPKDSAACGYAFTEGEKYLVFAREWGTQGKDGLTVSLCSLTQTFDDASDDIKELNGVASPITPTEEEGVMRSLMEQIIELLRELIAKYSR